MATKPHDVVNSIETPEVKPEPPTAATQQATTYEVIIIVDRAGRTLIATDKELFTSIRQKYNSMRRRGLFAWMYIVNDIHYVNFEIYRQLVGILESLASVPTPVQVQQGRYSYSPPPMLRSRTLSCCSD
jgi:hypothetical protein